MPVVILPKVADTVCVKALDARLILTVAQSLIVPFVAVTVEARGIVFKVKLPLPRQLTATV